MRKGIKILPKNLFSFSIIVFNMKFLFILFLRKAFTRESCLVHYIKAALKLKILLVPVNLLLGHRSRWSSYLPRLSQDCLFPLTKIITGLVLLLFLCRTRNLIIQWVLENVLFEICHVFNIYYSGIEAS